MKIIDININKIFLELEFGFYIKNSKQLRKDALITELHS